MKILYIASHLSTGGMPEVLRARVESLMEIGECEVWVLEYSKYSDNYTTQRDIIQSMLGDRFISLSWFSDNDEVIHQKYLSIKDLVERERFDVIHLDVAPETYDSFNKLDTDLLEFLYNSPDKHWKVVDTVHSSYFSGNVDKRWIPDGMMHCSEYTKNVTFSSFNGVIPTTVVEYPIWERVSNSIRPIEFDESKFNILNVGIWTPGKNQSEAIEMARYSNEQYSDKYIFHFVGAMAPNFRDYWQPLLDNLPSNVRIWDVQHHMDRFYNWADLVLFNSTYELNPIVLKEAVGYKKPLLIRNLPVYGGAYNGYAEYLTGDVIKDTSTLCNMLDNPKQLNYNFSQLKTMGYDMVTFYEGINSVKQKTESSEIMKRDAPISFSTQFLDGAFVEIIGNSDNTNYVVEFIDSTTNKVIYTSTIGVYHWVKTSLKYYVDWLIKITPDNPKYKTIEYKFNLRNKRVLINFESSSVGDTIAWIPYVEEFRKKHGCDVFCSTFHNSLFTNEYPNINFVNANEDVFNLYAKYSIGWFYKNGNPDSNSHKSHFISQPLQKTCSDILGLDYVEIKPNVKKFEYVGELPQRYFTFSLQSTAQSKYWNYKNGWYTLIELLKGYGLVGVCVDKYASFGTNTQMNSMPSNAVDKTGLSLEDTMGLISKAEFHIGLSSGLSWLAWAVNKPVVMISGFTDPILEFSENCIRIHNQTVCNGCFTNPSHTFDKSDWGWCPVHKGTEREFECTKSITPIMVFEKIKQEGLV